MAGIGLILINCVLFIHLGLGDTICKVFNINFILFHCVKCLTFWSILTYAFFIEKYYVVECVSMALVGAYAALWLELLLDKIAIQYEKLYSTVLVSKGTKNHKRRETRE